MTTELTGSLNPPTPGVPAVFSETFLMPAAELEGETHILRNVNAAVMPESAREHELAEEAELLTTRLQEEIARGATAEVALRESEERYRSLFRALPVAAFVCDMNATIQDYNPRAVELWGRTPKIGVEQHSGAVRLWLPDGTLLPHSQSPIVEVLRTGIPARNIELSIERPDGSRIPVIVNYSALQDEHREIAGVVISFEEITERKRWEEALRGSEERFRALVTASSDVVYRMNPDWKEMRQLCGRDFLADTQNANPDWLDEYVHPDDQSMVMAAVDEARRTKGIFELEHRVRRADGTLGWTFSRAVPLLDAQGEIREWFGAASDVTERRQAEEHLRFVMEAMPQKIYTTTASGEVDYFNAQWIEFTGLDLEQLRSLGWTQLVHPDDREESGNLWKHCLETGQPFRCERRFRARDGSYRWHLSHAVPFCNADGKVLMWIGSCTDIDDQKAAIKAALQAQKLESIGLLAAGIAHDFNNLLCGITGWSSLALDSIPAAHPAYGMLQHVASASERATHLTRQMLAYAGKGRFLIEPIDLSDIVAQTAELVTASIPKSVQVKLQLEKDLPPVQTDAGQMQQVVMNLIINAAEATRQDENGLITVRTRAEEIAPGQSRRDSSGNMIPPDLYAVLEVQDEGSGIEPAVLPKIFDPFFTTKFIGRGLGLAAVSGIVRSHRGAIEVETEAGNGSTFRVLLPAKYVVKAAEPAEPLTETAKQKETVLVIDDEATVRNLVQAILEKSGYKAIVASDGEWGLEFIRRHKEISLVLLDMSMPGMSGRQVLEAVRAIRSTLPVIISSGYSEVEICRQFSGLEVAGVLEKPFSSGRLLAKVKSILDVSQ